MRWLLVLVLSFLACASRPRSGALVSRSVLAGAPDGLSGLAVDDHGRLWAVPERTRALVQIEDGRSRAMPLLGVPDGLETESLAWIGPGRAALGTETQEAGREADHVLLVEVGDREARVVGSIAVPYAPLGLRAETNHGVEGLCVASGTVLATLEMAIERDGHRIAVLLRRPLSATPETGWERFGVRLTSATGTLSGIECRAAGDELEVLAIERHFEVMRLVTFRVPRTGPGRELEARLWQDLAGQLPDDPNLEGVVGTARGVLIVVDNHRGVATGPSEIIRVDRQW